ncbi:WXG100-like domain-containing protein [Actinomadura roseirufa]|uniref:WXG100-like domain-containing protein n=1 Tax=Actinomadura roseirufa TaxID=2094049 RepID=UPI0010410912|nr:ADP-ribosyltransferase [Actinomadura roseirufa]
MGLEIPDSVKWLSWIVGSDWPEGDETAMRRCADAWRDAGTGVNELIGDLRGNAADVLGVLDSGAADRFRQNIDKWIDADPRMLPKLAEACGELAETLDGGALDIEYAKLMFIALLIVTAVEIAWLIAAAFATFGASTAGIPAVEASAQVTARMIFRSLVERLGRRFMGSVLRGAAFGALQGGGLDLVVQSVQIAQGNRDGVDWTKTGAATFDGALGGAFSGGVGHGLGKIPGVGGPADTALGSLLKGMAREGTSEAIGGAGSTVATAAIHGDPLTWDAIAKGATSGAFGGAVGGGKGGLQEFGAPHPGGDPGAPPPSTGDPAPASPTITPVSDGGGPSSGGGGSTPASGGEPGGSHGGGSGEGGGAGGAHSGSGEGGTYTTGGDSGGSHGGSEGGTHGGGGSSGGAGGGSHSGGGARGGGESAPMNHGGGSDGGVNRIAALLGDGGGTNHGPSLASATPDGSSTPPGGSLGGDLSAYGGAPSVTPGSDGGTPASTPSSGAPSSGASLIGGALMGGAASAGGAPLAGGAPASPGSSGAAPTGGALMGGGPPASGASPTGGAPVSAASSGGSTPSPSGGGRGGPSGTSGPTPGGPTTPGSGSTPSSGAGATPNSGPTSSGRGGGTTITTGGESSNSRHADGTAADAPDALAHPEPEAAGAQPGIVAPVPLPMGPSGGPSGAVPHPGATPSSGTTRRPPEGTSTAPKPPDLASRENIPSDGTRTPGERTDARPEPSPEQPNTPPDPNGVQPTNEPGHFGEDPGTPADPTPDTADPTRTADDEGAPDHADQQPRPGEPENPAPDPAATDDSGTPTSDDRPRTPGEETPRAQDDGQPRKPEDQRTHTPGEDQPRTPDDGRPRTPDEERPRTLEESDRDARPRDDDRPRGEGDPETARDRSGDDGSAMPRGDVPPNLPGPLHEVWRGSQETPSGRTFLDPGDPRRGGARHIAPDPRRFMVSGNGDHGGLIVNGRRLSVSEVADLVRNDPGWDGRDVLMLSDRIGQGDVPARLAQELGVRVIAPTGHIGIDGNGRIGSSGWATHDPAPVPPAGGPVPTPVHPAAGQSLPAHDPRPGHVDPDGVRRFDTDSDGAAYGENHLAHVYNNLPPELQNALRWYTRQSMPNLYLRPGADLAGNLQHLTDEHSRLWHMVQLNDKKVPSLADVERMAARPDLQPHQRDIVNQVLHSPDPGRRLSEMVSAARHRRFLRGYFGEQPTVEAFNRRIGELDRALGQPLPEAVQATRGLHDIDFLRALDGGALAGRDPSWLVGTTQTEPGYMSTSLGENPAVVDNNPFEYRIRINLPEGAHGVWMGTNSIYPDQRELVLPRGTRYQITNVVQTGFDSLGRATWDIHATVLPPGSPGTPGTGAGTTSHAGPSPHPAYTSPATPHGTGPVPNNPYATPTAPAPNPIAGAPAPGIPGTPSPATAPHTPTTGAPSPGPAPHTPTTSPPNSTPNTPAPGVGPAPHAPTTGTPSPSTTPHTTGAPNPGTAAHTPAAGVPGSPSHTPTSGAPNTPHGTAPNPPNPTPAPHAPATGASSPSAAPHTPSAGVPGGASHAPMPGAPSAHHVPATNSPTPHTPPHVPGVAPHTPASGAPGAGPGPHVPLAGAPGTETAPHVPGAAPHHPASNPPATPHDSGPVPHNPYATSPGAGTPPHRPPSTPHHPAGGTSDPGAAPHHPAFNPPTPHGAGPVPHNPYATPPGAGTAPHHPGATPDAPGTRPHTPAAPSPGAAPNVPFTTGPVRPETTPSAPGAPPTHLAHDPAAPPHGAPVADGPSGAPRPGGAGLATTPHGAWSAPLHPGPTPPGGAGAPHTNAPGTNAPGGTTHRRSGPFFEAPHQTSGTPRPDHGHDGGALAHGVPAGLPEHLHDLYRLSERTPGGMSLYGEDDAPMRDLARRVPADPHRFILDAHGGPDGLLAGGRPLSVDDVAELVRHDPTWDGREVLLLSCRTGEGDFAAQLSQRLGVPVTAPTGRAWSDGDGNVYASSGRPGPDGRERPTIPPDGTWHTYHPDGTRTPAGQDGYAPGHESTRDDPDAPRAGAGHAAPRGPDPDADPLPGEVRDGFRRFATNGEGSNYGENHLGRVFHDLPPEQRRAILEYTRHSWPYNDLLRPDGTLDMAQVRQRLAEWHDSVYPGWSLYELTGGRVPTLDDIYDAIGRDDLTPDQERLITEIMDDADPGAALDYHVREGAGDRGLITASFGHWPTPEEFAERVRLMDAALDQPLPEPIEVQRGLQDVNFLPGFDPDNPDGLLGARWTEPGFTSAALGRVPPELNGMRPPVYLHLEVPAGIRALWMGTESVYPTQRELVLARFLTYEITDVRQFGTALHLYARAIPPGD